MLTGTFPLDRHYEIADSSERVEERGVSPSVTTVVGPWAGWSDHGRTEVQMVGPDPGFRSSRTELETDFRPRSDPSARCHFSKTTVVETMFFDSPREARHFIFGHGRRCRITATDMPESTIFGGDSRYRRANVLAHLWHRKTWPPANLSWQ